MQQSSGWLSWESICHFAKLANCVGCGKYWKEQEYLYIYLQGWYPVARFLSSSGLNFDFTVNGPWVMRKNIIFSQRCQALLTSRSSVSPRMFSFPQQCCNCVLKDSWRLMPTRLATLPLQNYTWTTFHVFEFKKMSIKCVFYMCDQDVWAHS